MRTRRGRRSCIAAPALGVPAPSAQWILPCAACGPCTPPTQPLPPRLSRSAVTFGSLCSLCNSTMLIDVTHEPAFLRIHRNQLLSDARLIIEVSHFTVTGWVTNYLTLLLFLCR